MDGNFNSNDSGEPGPYGSDPAHTFTGLDRVSREQEQFSDYWLPLPGRPYQPGPAGIFGSFFLNNSSYISPYGNSFNKDLRGQGEARTFSASRHLHDCRGVRVRSRRDEEHIHHGRELPKFPLRRDEQGIYWENRFNIGNRLFVNAGVRAEVFETPPIPAAVSSPFFATRPELGRTLMPR